MITNELRTCCLSCEEPIAFPIGLVSNVGTGEAKCSKCETNWKVEMSKPNKLGTMTVTWIDLDIGTSTLVTVLGKSL